ncbi:metallophosphoesterase [Aureimonas sp. AU12]|uniref:metallophosphoesterase n=1 Tax=Aureimonas sp. AU12 TaxID=1638161 RepID=UPI000AC40C6A|nr:metallophosphoesterase [Aureimonas sp. AU12]
MLPSRFQRMLQRPAWTRPASSQPRRRLRMNEEPALLYAIGDIHGCLEPLRALEAQILRDAAALRLPAVAVYLGDYVDRGPDSRGVLDHLIGPTPGPLHRICLAGNHDDVLLQLSQGRSPIRNWSSFGLRETLQSYGMDRRSQPDRDAAPADLAEILQACMPAAHIEWLRDLPVLIETPLHLFVHAGVRPGVSAADQVDHDLMWIREDFLKVPNPADRTVVHGHTPVQSVEMVEGRIDIDTNAARGGPLTALRILRGGPYAVLQAR